MAARNTLEAKKKRRVLKVLRQTPPSYVDLVKYIKMNTRCTTAMAEAVLLSGALKVGANVVGRRVVKDKLGNDQLVVDRYLPAHLYSELRVESPKVLKNA